MRWIKWFLTVLLLALSVLLALDIYISYQAQPYIYTDMKNVPPKKAALLLGTNKYIAKGKKNYYYLYRIADC
jgi:SanA protein